VSSVVQLDIGADVETARIGKGHDLARDERSESGSRYLDGLHSSVRNHTAEAPRITSRVMRDAMRR
jgi:hypothetical protein